MASPGLAYTKHTCVHYARGDALGKALAHASLAPVLLLVAQAAKVYTRREVHEAAALLGLLLAEGAARGLKHFIRAPRPPGSCARLGVCDAHGMPSSHTCMTFAYLALAFAAAAGAWRRQQPAARAWAVLELAACTAGAALVAASRVYLGYHSPDQVAAGAALGILLGAAWHAAMCAAGRAGLFSALAAWGPARLLCAKDTWGCAEPLLAEQALAYPRAAGADGGGGTAARGGSKRD